MKSDAQNGKKDQNVFISQVLKMSNNAELKSAYNPSAP